MLIESTIITTSRWLGDIKELNQQIRTFPRNAVNTLAIDDVLWRGAFEVAAKDMQISSFDKQKLRFPRGINAPTETYVRTYNKINKETFESIPENTPIHLRIVYADTQLEKEDLLMVLKHIGEFYGLSPWGNKFGYGRFICDE